jgi:hypothetical protein
MENMKHSKMAVFWVVAPCGATTEKIAIFILTTVRTSNPTYDTFCTPSRKILVDRFSGW